MSPVALRASSMWLVFASIATVAAAITEPLRGSESSALALALVVVAFSVPSLLIAERWRATGRLVLEPPVVLVGVLFLWHFAFWMVVLVGLASDYRLQEYFEIAPTVSLSALAACVCGVAAFAAGVRHGVSNVTAPTPDERTKRAQWHVRALCVTGAVLVIAYFLVRGYALVGEYDVYYLESDPLRRIYNLGLLLLLTGLGPVVYAERNPQTLFTQLAVVFAPSVLVSVLLGSRWALFTAALVYASARSLRGQRLQLARASVLLVALVLLGTIVKEVRRSEVTGGGNAVLVGRYTNPLIEFFEEIGQAYKAVAGTLELYATPDQYRYGATLVQAAASVIPSAGAVVFPDVQRPVHEIAEEYYSARFLNEGFTVGFSIIAELYLNFGVLGVLVGMYAIGLMLAYLYRRFALTHRYAYLYVSFALFAVLLFGVRNDALTWFRNAVWSSAILLVLGIHHDRRLRAWRLSPEPAASANQ